MNEPVSCWVCDRPGRLRLDTSPPHVEHDRGPGRRPRRCELPPRDIVHPQVRRHPRSGWSRYPSPWKAAS